MNRKELIEWLEGIRSESRNRIDKVMALDNVDWDSVNYQLGKIALCRTAIEKLEQQEESEAGE